MTSTERPVERLSNPRADRVRRTASLAGRSARQRQGLFLAEGPQPVREALTLWLRRWEVSPGSGDGPTASAELPSLDALYYEPESLRHRVDLATLLDRVFTVLADPGRDLPRSARPFIRECSAEVLLAIGDAQTSQGVLAVCRFPATPPSPATSCQDTGLAIAMLRVQDPGNAGTIIRAADAAGAGVVLIGPGTVDPWSPKVVRSAAGSHFHVPLVPAADPQMITTAAGAAGLQVLAAHGRAETSLADLPGLDRPTLWLMGNEAQGLTSQELSLADSAVSIPLYGQAESLNVATAATICLYSTAMAQHRVEYRDSGRR